MICDILITRWLNLKGLQTGQIRLLFFVNAISIPGNPKLTIIFDEAGVSPLEAWFDHPRAAGPSYLSIIPEADVFPSQGLVYPPESCGPLR